MLAGGSSITITCSSFFLSGRINVVGTGAFTVDCATVEIANAGVIKADGNGEASDTSVPDGAGGKLNFNFLFYKLFWNY